MKKIVCACLLTALALGTLACTAPLFKDYGRFDPSQETTVALESYAVVPEYRYYISGPDFYPNAIMGLDRNYRLDPAALWKEVDMTPQKMKELVQNVRTKAFENGEYYPTGFDLINDKGIKIGVWYSIMTARTFIHVQENGTVRIDAPELLPYARDRDYSM